MKESKLLRLVLESPWFLLIFTVIPLLVVLNMTLQLPFFVGVKPLFINNVAFALLITCRFLRYLFGLRKGIRYGAGRKPRQEASCRVSAADARRTMEAAGFSFEGHGGYGEKKDLGYLGLTLCYGGLLFVLAVGTLDNLKQFSGTLIDGEGPATKLSQRESYRELIAGPLGGNLEALPQMKILHQYMPSEQYPHGATEIAVMSEDGQQADKKTVRPGEPFHVGAYDIFMARFLVEPALTVTDKDKKPVFRAQVMMIPQVRKEGAYGFYAPFKTKEVSGQIYFRSDTNRLKVVMNRGGKWVFDGDMTFQRQQEVTKGDYTLSCEKMGYWTEIHVVHRRHLALLVLGGILAAAGLLLRIAFRPDRVWLAEDAEGCRIAVAGRDSSRLVAGFKG